MRRYTTPTISLTVEGVDLTGMDTYVTISQGGTELTVTNAAASFDGADTTIALALTQEQTERFRVGEAKVQVNWVGGDGMRNATTIGRLQVDDNLLRRVVRHGG